MVDIGITLHLHMAGLAVYHCIAAGWIGDELDDVLGGTTADVVDAYTILAGLDCRYLRHLLGVDS